MWLPGSTREHLLINSIIVSVDNGKYYSQAGSTDMTITDPGNCMLIVSDLCHFIKILYQLYLVV